MKNWKDTFLESPIGYPRTWYLRANGQAWKLPSNRLLSLQAIHFSQPFIFQSHSFLLLHSQPFIYGSCQLPSKSNEKWILTFTFRPICEPLLYTSEPQNDYQRLDIFWTHPPSHGCTESLSITWSEMQRRVSSYFYDCQDWQLPMLDFEKPWD